MAMSPVQEMQEMDGYLNTDYSHIHKHVHYSKVLQCIMCKTTVLSFTK